MEILLANDDGIHAPGLLALYEQLLPLGNVTVVAPAIEQSGVGHSITYLHPLLVHREYHDGKPFGWKVEGSPADCIKLGVMELCPRKPDLVVSGINSGANVGINVLYSGTVAAASEGAFFGITSFAISQWINDPPDYPAAAVKAVKLIRSLLDRDVPAGSLWNINLPSCRPGWPVGVRMTSMSVNRHTEKIEKREDPRGRTYFWSGLEPMRSHSPDPGTDVHALAEGYVTVTPLIFDRTDYTQLKSLPDGFVDLDKTSSPA